MEATKKCEPEKRRINYALTQDLELLRQHLAQKMTSKLQ